MRQSQCGSCCDWREQMLKLEARLCLGDAKLEATNDRCDRYILHCFRSIGPSIPLLRALRRAITRTRTPQLQAGEYGRQA